MPGHIGTDISQNTSIILGDIFSEFRDNPDLKVAIVTGAGEKFFSAGWDLKAVNDGEAADADYGVGGFGGLQELPNMNKPIIIAEVGVNHNGSFTENTLSVSGGGENGTNYFSIGDLNQKGIIRSNSIC